MILPALSPPDREAQPYCAFVVGEEHFALPFEFVLAVLDMSELRAAPTQAAGVVGVVRHGHSEVPVLDLRERLQLLPLAQSTTCILLLYTGSPQLSVLGIAIDHVEHIAAQIGEIEQLPRLARSAAPCLGRVAHLAEGLLLLIDPARLVSAAELRNLANLHEAHE
jgi:chemotaxis signal transduction protein